MSNVRTIEPYERFDPEEQLLPKGYPGPDSSVVARDKWERKLVQDLKHYWYRGFIHLDFARMRELLESQGVKDSSIAQAIAVTRQALSVWKKGGDLHPANLELLRRSFADELTELPSIDPHDRDAEGLRHAIWKIRTDYYRDSTCFRPTSLEFWLICLVLADPIFESITEDRPLRDCPPDTVKMLIRLLLSRSAPLETHEASLLRDPNRFVDWSRRTLREWRLSWLVVMEYMPIAFWKTLDD